MILIKKAFKQTAKDSPTCKSIYYLQHWVKFIWVGVYYDLHQYVLILYQFWNGKGNSYPISQTFISDIKSNALQHLQTFISCWWHIVFSHDHIVQSVYVKKVSYTTWSTLKSNRHCLNDGRQQGEWALCSSVERPEIDIQIIQSYSWWLKSS